MMKNDKIKTYLPKMTFLALLFFGSFSALAQEQDPEKVARAAREYMQEAEKALGDDDLASAEAYYRKAIAKDPSSAEARYNLGNLYYNKEITKEAVERHGQAANVSENKALKHNSFHNRGNAYMKQKNYKAAIEAYKNALRNNPADDETRYNLALAKKMQKEDEKEGGGKDNKDQQQDQQDQQQDQKQDQQNEGDQGEQEENQDGEPKNDKGDKENEDKKPGEDKKEEGKPQDQKQNENKGDKSEEQQPQQPKPQPGQLSPQQVKNLLEAMGNEERKVQQKINAEKAKGVPVKTEKDW